MNDADVLPLSKRAAPSKKGSELWLTVLRWFDSYPQDKRPWILPDVPVPDMFPDWMAGRDPAIEAALTHRAQPADELSRERIFFYERPSQAQDWKPFWA